MLLMQANFSGLASLLHQQHLASVMEHACFGIDSLVGVQNNAQRLTRCRNEANVQLGVVSVDRLHADKNRIAIPPQLVHLFQTSRGREPCGLLRSVVNRPVGVQRQLDGHEGSPVFAPVHEGPHLFVSFGLHEADTSWNARIFEHATTVPSNGGVWVVMSDDWTSLTPAHISASVQGGGAQSDCTAPA